MLTQHTVMDHVPSNDIWLRWVWGWWRCCGLLVPLGGRIKTPRRREYLHLWMVMSTRSALWKRTSWSTNRGCGPQIAVEEDMVVKLGPLVAVVVVEAAAAASAASAASAATAAVCCLLSAVCCLLLAAVCCYCCLCCYHVAVHRICSTSLRYREADQRINYIHVLQQQVCE